MLGRLSALALILGLLGCSDAPKVVWACPEVQTFTAAQQKAMATALKQLPPGSPLEPLAVDWERMRTEAKACDAR